MSEKIKIDPEKFAYQAMQTYKVSSKDSMERVAKNELNLFLESYFLIEKFNKLEANNFKLFSDEEKAKILHAISKSSQNQ